MQLYCAQYNDARRRLCDVTDHPQLALDQQLCFPLYAATRAVTKQYAVLLEGTGLTCSTPDGYVQQGYASDGVPPGIYPLYVPPPG